MSPVGAQDPGFLRVASRAGARESGGVTCNVHFLCRTSVIRLGHLAGSSSQPMAGCCKPCSLNTAPQILKINCKHKIEAGSEVASLGLTSAVPGRLLCLTDRGLLLVWFSPGATWHLATFTYKFQAKTFWELFGVFMC